MLTRTFQHIQGVGPATEEMLWDAGVESWEEYLRRPVAIPQMPRRELAREVALSVKRLEAGDAAYFNARLPGRERWRLYREFLQRAVYLDIETTGLSPGSSAITMVGLYDGQEYRAFVRGRDLDRLPQELRRYSLVVTYNGLSFDAPFIKAEMGPVLSHCAHVDVMYPLRRLGYRGGLKAIEGQLGLGREAGMEGLDGYDAVVLWELYRRGDSRALETLVRYNAEDVASLPRLAELAYNGLAGQLPIAVPSLPLSPRPDLDLPYDRRLVARLRAGHGAPGLPG